MYNSLKKNITGLKIAITGICNRKKFNRNPQQPISHTQTPGAIFQCLHMDLFIDNNIILTVVVAFVK